VERECRRVRRALRALREDDLERVALPDVLLARRDARLVLGLRGKALRESGDQALARRTWCVLVEGLRDRRRVAVQDLRDPAYVVEPHEHVGCHEAALRETAAGGRQRDGRLELRDEV